MTFQELKKIANTYAPAIYLESFFPYSSRQIVGKAITFVLLASFLLSSGIFGSPHKILWGVFFLALGLRIKIFLMDALYNSYYFRGSQYILNEPGLLPAPQGIDFDTALLVYATSEKDVTSGFLDTVLGKELISRLGIPIDDVHAFLKNSERAPVWSSRLVLPANITLGSFAEAVFDADQNFANFLFAHGIDKAIFGEALVWISRMHETRKRRARYWGRDSLGRIRGIGKEWALGKAYLLERYSTDIRETKDYNKINSSVNYYKNEVDSLESILARHEEANAIIVAEKGSRPLDIVSSLVKKIVSGEVLPSLEHKRVMILNTNALIAGAGSKAYFEEDLLTMLNDANKAQNIILVIPDFSSFIVSAQAVGSDVASLLDTYLASSNIQFVAIDDPASFNKHIESSTQLMQRFEVVRMTDGDIYKYLCIVEDAVEEIETKIKMFFTYPAIKAIVSGAERYFPNSVMPDKALDILFEIVPVIHKTGKVFVDKNDIVSLIENKTGIPSGDVKDTEREKLLNLETVLHDRVIGQNEAITMISNAMRRARSGISNPNRPFGSFLFLGPTGVGKTETAKALAQVFFGNEEKMLRLDMSEYNTNEGLERLIGSFESNTPGVLVSLLRDEPYGVLLLDEFEKTNKDVLDLFLQILDEGVFSDMNGKKVNARNTIIIATSNAGSDLVWDIVRSGGVLAENKTKIIDEIVKRNIFKPELLNRFDGAVLFHPLDKESLQKIAVLMLKKLSSRLKTKGIMLEINDELIDFLVAEGNDPQFGARPLNRAIQEKVEKVIAEKMIRGDVRAGSKIALTKIDLV